MCSHFLLNFIQKGKGYFPKQKFNLTYLILFFFSLKCLWAEKGQSWLSHWLVFQNWNRGTLQCVFIWKMIEQILIYGEWDWKISPSAL